LWVSLEESQPVQARIVADRRTEVYALAVCKSLLGKSTVIRALEQEHAAVIDMDLLSREVVQPGTSAWRAIVKEFGNDVLNPDSTLNRTKLRERVFSDPEKRRKLNAIMRWPLLFALIRHLGQHFLIRRQRVVVLDAALLIETSLHRVCSTVAVVNTPPDVQLQRLMERDSIDRDAALRIITAQAPLQRKLEQATIVIDGLSLKQEMQDNARHWWRREIQQSKPCASTAGVFAPTPVSFAVSVIAVPIVYVLWFGTRVFL